MIELVYGGSGSGKSEFAEKLILDSECENRFYIATMKIFDDEGKKRVERHRKLRGNKNFISIFIYADLEARIARVIERHPGIDRKAAIKKIEQHDKKRAAYHDYFCKRGKWGDRKSYELCIDASKLGVDGTTDLIYNYIQKRIK